MSTVDVDVITNSVVVGLERETPDALAELQRRYGSRVAIENIGALSEDACNSRNDCGGTASEPWKDGLKIFLALQQSDFCTSGILARRAGNLVVVTAAHCHVNYPADYGDNWKHNTVTPQIIGNGYGGTIDDADGPPGDGCLCHSDEFYAINTADIRDVARVPDDSEYMQQVGSTICRGGAKSGYVCGQIDKLNAARTNLDGHNVDMLRRTDFEGSPGDSGAVMFVGRFVLGIHNDSLTDVDPPDPGHSWCTTGERIEAVGNVVCLTSTC